MNFGLDIDKEKSKLKLYDLHYQELWRTANSGYRELVRIFTGWNSSIGTVQIIKIFHSSVGGITISWTGGEQN